MIDDRSSRSHRAMHAANSRRMRPRRRAGITLCRGYPACASAWPIGSAAGPRVLPILTGVWLTGKAFADAYSLTVAPHNKTSQPFPSLPMVASGPPSVENAAVTTG